MLDRRAFLSKFGSLGVLALGCGSARELIGTALAAAEDSVPLRLYNQNTRENYDIQLFIGSEWNPNALILCDWLMRDHRQQQMVNCDRKLYATLYVIQRYFSQQGRINIHSGFRTEATNNLLREKGYGAAPNSQHLLAKAVDFSIPGVDLKQVARAAWNLKLGGIGLYDSFVHVDTRATPISWGHSLS